MEVKINREVRDFTENVYFGLSLRQAAFSAAAIGIAVAVFFGLRDYFDTETVSWMCVLAAAPFAAMGFLSYNGMTAEKFVLVWIKAQFIMPRRLISYTTNFYERLMENSEEMEELLIEKNQQ